MIGRRPLDTHFLALMELGTRVESGTFFVLSADKLSGAQIFLDETSVTATENCLMAAVLAEGTTVIENAASEPHVQDLCRMLVAMGARISGIGSNILTIQGVKRLSGHGLPHRQRLHGGGFPHRACRGDARRDRDRGRGAPEPAHDEARLPEAGHHLGDLRGDHPRARRRRA